MTSTLKSRKELTVMRKKLDKSKEISNETSKTLNQLLMRSNITVKRKSLLENKVPTIWENVERTDIPGTAKIEVHSLKPRKGDQRSLLIPENNDYLPDRRKRNVPIKKIVLQARHDYKIVGATNKRKRRIPQKELKTPPVKVVSSDPELSMDDLIKMAEDQGMDDDDFMEILTCPSPVWWEEGSDDEEVIRIRLNKDPEGHDGKNKYQNYTINSDELNETYNNLFTCDSLKGKSLKSDVNFFKKFVKKRSKLESVLGNIKYKKTVPELDKNNCIDYESNSKARKNSVGGLSDVSINEEDLLNTLECIEIPVQKIDNKSEDADENQEKTEANEVIQSNKRALKNDSFDVNQPRKSKRRTRKPRKSFSIFNELKKEDKRPHMNVTEESCPKESDAEIDDANLEIITTDLPPLTKKPIRSVRAKSGFSSPKSVESTTSENSSAVEFDSISDTNIKFLDEYLDERNDSKYCMKPSKNQEGELVTVYKILSNQIDDVDIEDEIKINLVNKSPDSKNKKNRKINSFYKKRKRTYRRNSCVVQDGGK